LTPREDKVDVITQVNILFRGGGNFLGDDDDDNDVDDDHDDCKCGATSGLGNMFETTSQKMYGSRLKPCHAYIYNII
jgi:hypothetical protein